MSTTSSRFLATCWSTNSGVPSSFALTVQVLWLEANGLREVSGLEAQTCLRALMLQENALSKIENLGHLHELTQLNLSNNCIERIEGLSTLTKLEVRNASQQRWRAAASLFPGLSCRHASPLHPSCAAFLELSVLCLVCTCVGCRH